jgi:hypothetical protein
MQHLGKSTSPDPASELCTGRTINGAPNSRSTCHYTQKQPSASSARMKRHLHAVMLQETEFANPKRCVGDTLATCKSDSWVPSTSPLPFLSPQTQKPASKIHSHSKGASPQTTVATFCSGCMAISTSASRWASSGLYAALCSRPANRRSGPVTALQQTDLRRCS